MYDADQACFRRIPSSDAKLLDEVTAITFIQDSLVYFWMGTNQHGLLRIRVQEDALIVNQIKSPPKLTRAKVGGVVPGGIEPPSQAPETYILSVVLRDQVCVVNQRIVFLLLLINTAAG